MGEEHPLHGTEFISFDARLPVGGRDHPWPQQYVAHHFRGQFRLYAFIMADDRHHAGHAKYLGVGGIWRGWADPDLSFLAPDLENPRQPLSVVAGVESGDGGL
ncbi:hypothetical protein D3C80_1708490 [compost metagenome]